MSSKTVVWEKQKNSKARLFGFTIPKGFDGGTHRRDSSGSRPSCSIKKSLVLQVSVWVHLKRINIAHGAAVETTTVLAFSLITRRADRESFRKFSQSSERSAEPPQCGQENAFGKHIRITKKKKELAIEQNPKNRLA